LITPLQKCFFAFLFLIFFQIILMEINSIFTKEKTERKLSPIGFFIIWGKLLLEIKKLGVPSSF
jgi:hypothetical protein